MDAPTLGFLKDVFQAGDPNKRIVKAPAEPADVYYVMQEDGRLERVFAEPPPRAHAAADLETLVAAAARLPDAEEAHGVTADVWYDRSAVVALIPSLGGRERCTLALEPSPQFAQLVAWDRDKRATIDQAALVLLLRTTLADCFPDHPKLLDCVRAVKTSKTADVNSQIQHGKVSLGKSVMAEMSGLDGIPQEVTFTVPVFANALLHVRAKVRVCVDPDPQREVFTLVVIPGQVEHAFATGEAYLALRLGDLLGEGSKIPLYHGRP